MKLKDIEKGKEIIFEIGEKKIDTIYWGRFDFLYCFNTNFKMLPKVTTVDNESIVIINFELLNKYNFLVDDVKAILYHEVGHIISVKQKDLNGIDLEFDADEYSVSMIGKNSVISALNKTKNLIVNEANSKKTKNTGIEELKKRIEKVKVRDDLVK